MVHRVDLVLESPINNLDHSMGPCNHVHAWCTPPPTKAVLLILQVSFMQMGLMIGSPHLLMHPGLLQCRSPTSHAVHSRCSSSLLLLIYRGTSAGTRCADRQTKAKRDQRAISCMLYPDTAWVSNAHIVEQAD